MEIKCDNCGYTEKASKELFVNIIGGALPIGGLWAWTAYFFAGTGFALPIVTAMIMGGPAILIYKKQIVTWLTNKGHKCKQCGEIDWV